MIPAVLIFALRLHTAAAAQEPTQTPSPPARSCESAASADGPDTLIRCHGFQLALPFKGYSLSEPGGTTLLLARSDDEKVIASVTLDPEPQDTPIQVYLTAQLTTVQEKVKVLEPNLARYHQTPILAYWVKESGISQLNFWAALQRPDHHILRLHVSTTQPDSARRKVLGNTVLRLMDDAFKLSE